MALVYDVNDEFQSAKHTLLRKSSAKMRCLYDITLGCDVLKKPGVDGIGAKQLNDIAKIIIYIKRWRWFMVVLKKNRKRSKEMKLTYMKTLIYEPVVETNITNMEYMYGTSKVQPESLKEFASSKVDVLKSHLIVTFLAMESSIHTYNMKKM